MFRSRNIPRSRGVFDGCGPSSNVIAKNGPPTWHDEYVARVGPVICTGICCAAPGGTGVTEGNGGGTGVGRLRAERAGLSTGWARLTSEHELSPEARLISPSSDSRRFMQASDITQFGRLPTPHGTLHVDTRAPDWQT
jgi:hypothetical protein